MALTAEPGLHSPDLGGIATTAQVTRGVIEAIRGDNSGPQAQTQARGRV